MTKDIDVGKWISVDDELPEVYQAVLIYAGNLEGCDVAHRSLTGLWVNGAAEVYNRDAVTHWQPLPAPPEAK